MFARNRKDRGVVLLTVTIVILTLAVLGSAFMLTSVSNNRFAQSQAHKARASVIAESGVDVALFEMAYGGAVFGNVWDRDLAGGTLHVETRPLLDSTGQPIPSWGVVVSRGLIVTSFVDANGNGRYDPASTPPETIITSVPTTVEATVVDTTEEIHQLFFKAIYAGNRWGGFNNIELAGVNHNQHDYRDNIDGDIHIEGDIWLGGDASPHRFGRLECTGQIMMCDKFLGTPDHALGGGQDDSILPPDLASQGYDRPQREYRSWDPSFQGAGRDVVNVNNEYAHYQSLGQIQTIKIDCESSSAWNYSAKSLPDAALANFFQTGYQYHYVKTYNSTDDSRIDATNNFYLGARNGGTSSRSGSTYGLYGGGHAVIPIDQDQNNKVYYLDGNLWIDSDGCNHVFFVPGDGVDKINITIVAKGNIYIGDQVFVTTNAVNPDQYDRNIGTGSQGLNAPCFHMTDPDSGVALVAMRDGESYDDINKNGKYDVGETINGREDPGSPVPAANNPSSGDYRGRWEGSGNIVFGDTINGPIGVVEAFMFAENNFMDISSDTSSPDQNPYIFGNMTAGNKIFLNRYYPNWLSNTSWKVSNRPTDWTYSKVINNVTYYYPPGTNSSNYNDPMVTYRRMYKSSGKWYVQLMQHVPTDLTYDDRIERNIINLPGLPHANSTVQGTWQIRVWRQY